MVGRQISSVDYSHLHLKGVTLVDRRGAGYGRAIELRSKGAYYVPQPLSDEEFAYGGEAVCRGSHDSDFLEGLDEALGGCGFQGARLQVLREFRLLTDALGDSRADSAELLLKEGG